MRNFERNFQPRIPIFFKLWFGFVAFLVIGIFATIIYFLVAAAQVGPEGIGREIGKAVKGFTDATGGR